mgnify:CR=1 FL=1
MLKSDKLSNIHNIPTNNDNIYYFNLKESIHSIKKRYKLKNIYIDLTQRDLIKFSESNCFYCSQESNDIQLDLINKSPDIGFRINNCVPSCFICYRMKNDGFNSLEEFYQICLNIKTKFGSINQSSNNNFLEFDEFQKKNQSIEIKKDEYYQLISNKCYCCDNLNETSVTLGKLDQDMSFNYINCVSLCVICNKMRTDLNLDEFKLLIEQINITYQTKSHYNSIKKLPKNITNSWLIDKINKLSDFYKISNSLEKTFRIDNRSANFKPRYTDDHYKKLVYNSLSLKNFQPDIEFVENDEQEDLWLYFRLKMSALKQSKIVGFKIKMLIRDKKTKHYIGIASLSSDIYNLAVRDSYIGWTNTQKIDQGRLNCILNLSTCVGLRPFCYNFNGGKLIAKLMFSQEVFEYVKQRYPQIKLVGILTTSIYGKSIQYDRLPELKFIGYSKGFGTIHIPDILLDAIDIYISQYKLNIRTSSKKNKLFKLLEVSKHLGLNNSLVNHGIQRGVYFGYLCTNAKSFLCGDNEIELKYSLKSIQNIYDDWQFRWAIQRFNHLKTEYRLLLDTEFNSNCILRDSDLTNIRVNNFRHKKLDNNSQSESELQKKITIIINNLQEKPNLNNSELSRILTMYNINITRQSINRLRNKYNLYY